jgi:adenylate cyclase
MNLKFKNKNRSGWIFLAGGLFFLGIVLFRFWNQGFWMSYDFKVLDHFHRLAVEKGSGPQPCFVPGITYLVITDETYRYFGKNILDRKDLARINQILSRLNPRGVAYDMIFAMPGPLETDQSFARSLANLKSLYLPVGCALSQEPVFFNWKTNEAGKSLFDHLIRPVETGIASPFYAVKILAQQERFTKAARGIGDISVRADPDGVYRHIPLLVKVGQDYLPSLSLSMFLDQAKVPLDSLTVKWGESISFLLPTDGRKDGAVTIPIDRKGMTYVPFIAPMGQDFPVVAVHTLDQVYNDEDLRGNLEELFEGNFVIISDTATGAADLGATPLETSAPLVTIHASLLNSLLTQTFYSPWNSMEVMLSMLFVAALFCFSALFRRSGIIYGSGLAVFVCLTLLTWFEFTHFRLFPIATVSLSGMLLFTCLVVMREYTASKDRSMIRNIFSRYVPKAVVNELLANPGNLNLGGKEKVATVLFSDIAEFTSISERLAPEKLVSLLNQYLTEMTAVILEEGGIIDKFQGDAIMAEFGVPLPCPDHADRAVRSGLRMQERLVELRHEWKNKGLPELHCRIGINTGKMIVGNMGSQWVLDYTVIGDSVNLASRLEGANKLYGTSLMVSEFTLGYLSTGRYGLRTLDILRVKGKTEPVKVYEVYGYQKDPLSQGQATYYTLYEKAYALYLGKDFLRAEGCFQEALDLIPGDPAAKMMIQRIKHLSLSELPSDWDGSIELTSK